MNSTDKKTNKISALILRLLYIFIRVTAALPGLLWMRPRILYENEAARRRIRGGALLVSNHVSVLDPVYVMFTVWYRQIRFVCLKEFFDGGFRSLIFRISRCIPIDRENVGVDTLREIVSALKAEEAVAIFPEGHIKESDEAVDSFKSGAVLMSVMSGRPIVPVYIQKSKRFFSRLTAVVGEPMDPAAAYGKRPTGEQLRAFSEAMHGRELELAARCNRKETK